MEEEEEEEVFELSEENYAGKLTVKTPWRAATGHCFVLFYNNIINLFFVAM